MAAIGVVKEQQADGEGAQPEGLLMEMAWAVVVQGEGFPAEVSCLVEALQGGGYPGWSE